MILHSRPSCDRDLTRLTSGCTLVACRTRSRSSFAPASSHWRASCCCPPRHASRRCGGRSRGRCSCPAGCRAIATAHSTMVGTPPGSAEDRWRPPDQASCCAWHARWPSAGSPRSATTHEVAVRRRATGRRATCSRASTTRGMRSARCAHGASWTCRGPGSWGTGREPQLRCRWRSPIRRWER